MSQFFNFIHAHFFVPLGLSQHAGLERGLVRRPGHSLFDGLLTDLIAWVPTLGFRVKRKAKPHAGEAPLGLAQSVDVVMWVAHVALKVLKWTWSYF